MGGGHLTLHCLHSLLFRTSIIQLTKVGTLGKVRVRRDRVVDSLGSGLRWWWVRGMRSEGEGTKE